MAPSFQCICVITRSPVFNAESMDIHESVYCILLFLAGCLFVSIEVMRNSVEYEREKLPKRHPEGSKISYGFSFALAWVVFALYLLAGLIFLVFSTKRKGAKAISELEAQENEPIHLRRN